MIDVTPKEAMEIIEEDGIIILDVRTPAEFATGKIKHAINIDIYQDDFKERISKLDKKRKYLVYCRTGSRSAGATQLMSYSGFRKVYNMLGGIMQWNLDGLPVD